MRTEKVIIKTTVNKEQAGFLRPEFNDCIPQDSSIKEGDTLNITYSFIIDYFGQTVERFEKLIKAMDAGIVVEINLEELKYGRCLVNELLTKMIRLQDKLENKDGLSGT